MKNNYYVYLYLDPRKPGRFEYGNYEFLYEPFYVGKGRDRRWKDLSKRSEYFKRKINKIKELDFEPIVIKINENLFENEAFELEIKLIKEIGRKNLDEGPLINISFGGEGSSGYKWSDKQLQERKKDFSEIKQAFEDDDYTLYTKEEEYMNSYTKLKYKHNPCGTEHEINWNDFHNGGHGCPLCGNKERTEKLKTDWGLIEKTFEERDYELKSTKDEYINNKTLLKYKHKKCGTEHEISWERFYNDDQGCPKCGKEKNTINRRKNFNYIIKAFEKRGYELVSTEDEYENCYSKLKYKHKKCGTEHEICWTNFQQGYNCPNCWRKKQKMDFSVIEKSFIYLGFELLTKEYEYENSRTKLKYKINDLIKTITWNYFKQKYKSILDQKNITENE